MPLTQWVSNKFLPHRLNIKGLSLVFQLHFEVRTPQYDPVQYDQPFETVTFQLLVDSLGKLRVTLLEKSGLLLIANIFCKPSTFFLVDIRTGTVIGSKEIPCQATVALNTLDIRDREQDYFRFIEDKIKIRQLSIDEEGIIPYIREELGEEELAKSVAARTGWKGTEDLFSEAF